MRHPPCTYVNTKAITTEDTVSRRPRDPRRGSQMPRSRQLNTPTTEQWIWELLPFPLIKQLSCRAKCLDQLTGWV